MNKKEALRNLVCWAQDLHPPLGDRLAALMVTIVDVANSALDVQPKQPALQLVFNHEQIEEEISGAYQAIVARNHNIDLEAHEESETAS